jgi:hypothetical protein
MSSINQPAPEDSDKLYDPHHLWRGLGPNDSLPYETVLEGFARYLAHTIRWSWDDQTPVQHPYYLARDEGLRAYCRHAATARLGMQPRPSYTLVQFEELIFFEQMCKAAREAAGPGRSSLFEQVRKILLKRKLPEGDMGRCVFCLLWDRATIPLEFWTYRATERFLATKLQARNAAPNEQRLRKWASRMELVHGYPSVVTNFNFRVGIPERGFNAEAFEPHGIPAPPEAALQMHNSA